MPDANRRGAARAVLTLRGLEREFQVSRDFLGEIVGQGELPALQRGRAFLVLREDFLKWWRGAARRQLRALEREERRP